MFEFVLNSIHELPRAIDAITNALGDTGWNLWWRGQGDRSWPLLPSAKRRTPLQLDEPNMALKFAERAKPRGVQFSHDPTSIDWLMLMQHYHLPTRLLDSSESALVGLCFVVDDLAHFASDGALFVLSPSVLNGAMSSDGRVGVPTSTAKEVTIMAGEVFEPELWKRLPATTDDHVVAFWPMQSELRMMNQHTTFTIHRSARPLATLPNAEKWLARIVVPSTAKTELRKRLYQFGLRRSVLFPDLSNLAAEIASYTVKPR